jgi:hypothetical protein
MLAVLAVSCKHAQQGTRELIAKTSDHVLYKDEVISAMPISLSAEDSVTFVKNYVDDWLHFTLLYEKADENIPDDDSVLLNQVKRFRKELYINTYEQMFLMQKLDTLIPQKEIDEYYAKHSNEFILSSPVVKPTMIVFPKEKKEDIKVVEDLFFSKRDDALDELKNYCFMHCQKFSFANTWVDLDAMKQELPFGVREEVFTRNGAKLQDTSNVYFVRIEESLSAGSPMPVELVHDKIAKVILQSRKVELLKTMRNKIYQEASHRRQFEVYY